jgi:hypothetical protein
MTDTDMPDEVMIDAVKTKGYCIYPSQLFSNVVAAANINESLNTNLATIFTAIEASASGKLKPELPGLQRSKADHRHLRSTASERAGGAGSN